MAAISIKGSVTDSKRDFVRTDLPLGTETITATVGAGEIALVIDTGVRLDSGQIDRIAVELASALREARYLMT